MLCGNGGDERRPAPRAGDEAGSDEERMDPFGGGVALLTYAQFQNALRIEFGRARRYAFPLSCVVVSLDGWARLRERAGADARDAVIRGVLERIQPQLRASDLVASYHDRLVLLLPHAGVEGACAAAERLLARIRGAPFDAAGERLSLAASIGVATLDPRATIFYDSLVKSAEAASEQAARSGGNQVVCSGSTAIPS